MGCCEVHNKAEAGFLVTLLNAACLNRAFSDSKESGRHFQLHPWRKIPIPKFDQCNRQHGHLAELCTKAEELAQMVAKNTLERKPKIGQVGISKAIRNELYSSEVGQEIEDIVAGLFPELTTMK